MKTIATLLAIGCLGLAWPATAQIDPEPDGIGIYADLAATRTSVTADPGVPFEVYLMITRPSNPSGIQGWECGIEVPGNAVIWGWNVAGDHWFNVGSPPEFEVAYGQEPLPAVDAVLLMTFIVYLTDSDPAEFYIHECQSVPGRYEWPAYVGADDINTLIRLHPWPRLAGQPAFKINDTSTPVVLATWGVVKSLFR
jgi:hypothetical protein